MTQRTLPRVVSDHCPLLVEASGMSRGESPSYVLAYKLRALKGYLKHWNKNIFGDVTFRKKSLLTELLDIDLR